MNQQPNPFLDKALKAYIDGEEAGDRHSGLKGSWGNKIANRRNMQKVASPRYKHRNKKLSRKYRPSSKS